jgi:hypothetical protein
MKKYYYLLALLIGCTAFAQKGPKIVFSAAENTIDYGKVYKDTDSGVRVFEFKNTGDAPLIIADVQSTCGCTIPTKPTEPIMPGVQCGERRKRKSGHQDQRRSDGERNNQCTGKEKGSTHQ